MKLPLKWLNIYVEPPRSRQRVCFKCLCADSEVADIIPEMKVSNVVVCTITQMKHTKCGK